ncbi:MAG: hypothetical protein IKR94_03250 [Bacteroidales bacterium]|nr:hypothetical protein [Bacteroidales bacterium]
MYATDDFFDIFEQQQIDNTNTLVHLEADLENTEWYNNSIYKVVYDYILKNNLRVPRQLSYPPADAMTIFNSLSLNHDHLTDTEINNGIASGIYDSGMITYNVIFYCRDDARSVKNLIQKKVTRKYTDDEQRILNSSLESYTPGDYPFIISYRLPGKGIETTKITRTLKF